MLLSHQGIADAAVIGIPDAEAGEVPKAFVVKKDPQLKAEDVMRFVKGNPSEMLILFNSNSCFCFV